MAARGAAQQTARIARIGYLITGALRVSRTNINRDAFRQGLNELGYIEGRNIVIEYRSADGKIERLPGLATELVGLKVDLIVALATPAGRAAQRATTTIPIVVTAMGDPVRDGLVASLARPGGNITGTTFLGPELVPKRLSFLRELLPTISRVAVLWHPGAFSEPTIREMLNEVAQAARRLGVQLQLVEVRSADEFDHAFTTMVGARAEACSSSRALCSLMSEDASSTWPRGTGCLRCSTPGSLCNWVASLHMGRISPVKSARRGVRGQDSQGSQTVRPTRRAANQI